MRAVYVVGDSHTRSFAYSERFVPIFVAKGNELLLHPANKLAETTLRLQGALKALPREQRIFLLLGEPTIRNYLSQGGSADVQGFVEGLVDGMEAVGRGFTDHRHVFILPPIPRMDEMYRRVHHLVTQRMKLSSQDVVSRYAGVFDEITRDGALQPYVGDYIHCNHLLGRFLERKLFGDEAPSIRDWPFRIELGPSLGQIWGGVPVADLVYQGTTSRNWRVYDRTLEKARLAARLVNILRPVLGGRDLVVSSSSDGCEFGLPLKGRFRCLSKPEDPERFGLYLQMRPDVEEVVNVRDHGHFGDAVYIDLSGRPQDQSAHPIYEKFRVVFKLQSPEWKMEPVPGFSRFSIPLGLGYWLVVLVHKKGSYVLR